MFICLSHTTRMTAEQVHAAFTGYYEVTLEARSITHTGDYSFARIRVLRAP